MKDPTYKRCRCRDEGGRELGPRCPKLRRADGSWSARHGTWYFRLEMPPGPGGKRRPALRQGGFDSQAGALAAWEGARDKLRRGADPSLRLTTSRWLDEWLARCVDLKPTTVHAYQTHIRLYLKPLLGHIPLDKLDAGDITEMFAEISRWNEDLAAGNKRRPHQVHCGPMTFQRIRATLRTALSEAVRDEKIATNPAKRVRMPKADRKKPVVWTEARTAEFWQRLSAWIEGDSPYDRFKSWRHASLRPAAVMVWTPEQTGRFLDSVTGDRLSALFELAAATGMRRGELAGLQWSDVDLDDGTVTIAHARVTVGWKVVDEKPKSDAGHRTVAIDKQTVKALRRHRAQQSSERLAWGSAWADSGLLFTREDGRPVHPGMISGHFLRCAFGADLPPVSLHGMRHGSATYLLAAGVDVKVVQERLGHSTSTLTRDTYTSVLTEVAREAAEIGSAVIPRAGTGTSGLHTDSQARTRPRGLSGSRTLPQVRGGGAPGARTQNPRIKRRRDPMTDGNA